MIIQALVLELHFNAIRIQIVSYETNKQTNVDTVVSICFIFSEILLCMLPPIIYIFYMTHNAYYENEYPVLGTFCHHIHIVK
jgi:hypothetical protein